MRAGSAGRIRRKGAPVAAVAYRGWRGDGYLLVSGRGSGGAKSLHVFAPVETSGGRSVFVEDGAGIYAGFVGDAAIRMWLVCFVIRSRR
jgi:hypothetical protein